MEKGALDSFKAMLWAGRQAVVGAERSQAVNVAAGSEWACSKRVGRITRRGTSPLASPWGHLRGMFVTREVLVILY